MMRARPFRFFAAFAHFQRVDISAAYEYVYCYQKNGKSDEAILSFAAWTKAGLCDNVGHHRGAESITLERASVQRPTVWALQLHIGAVERPFLLF